MQRLNFSENKSISGYVGATNAQLQIMSVPTQMMLLFPAFLTDFSQTFDATWNTEEVFGRMDPIATYQGTKRTMSLGFDLPAGSLDEAKQNLHGCSELVKMVYPVYNNQKILAKPPLVRIKFANLIAGKTYSSTAIAETIQSQTPLTSVVRGAIDAEGSGEFNVGATGVAEVDFDAEIVSVEKIKQVTTTKEDMLLGWISGLSWKPVLDMGMFTTGEELYPKVIGLSFSFNILHEQTLSQPTLGKFPFGGN